MKCSNSGNTVSIVRCIYRIPVYRFPGLADSLHVCPAVIDVAGVKSFPSVDYFPPFRYRFGSASVIMRSLLLYPVIHP